MPAYSVLDVTPTDDAWVQSYVAANRVAAHGGRYLARTTDHQQLEGEDRPATLRIVIEWPSKEAALGFMNDEAYAPHLAARTAGAISHHFLIAGQDDLA